jgi:hypothetical protein
MKEASKAFFSLVLSASWIAGIVLADGWLKLVAALLPPYAWYLFIERLMKVYGLL